MTRVLLRRGQQAARIGLRAAVALTIVLAFAASGQAGTAMKNPDVLLWGVYFEPSTLDPHTTTELAAIWLADNMYDTLVRYRAATRDGRLVGTADIGPSLAESWDISADGLTYTFHLRRGARFHDGSEVTAEAVRYSLARVLRLNFAPASTLKDYLAPDGIRALDRYTVQMRLKRPSPFFLHLLANTATGAIVNPARVEANGGIQDGQINEWMRRHEAGSGPFAFGEWVPGERYELVAFKDYWGGAPKLDKVVFRVINDFSTQFLLLQRGELDIVYRLPPEMVSRAVTNPELAVTREAGVGLHTLYLNNKVKPFDDPRVRQAVMYAINADEINQAAAFGFATVARSCLPSAIEGFNPQLWPYREDLGKARALLAEAGYAGGFTTELYYNSGNTEREQTAVALQAQLARVGVNVQIRSIAWPTYVSYFQEGKMPMFILSSVSMPIADVFVRNTYHSASAGRGNYAFFSDPALDGLIDRLPATFQPADRKVLLDQIQARCAEQMPSPPIYEVTQFYVLRKWVKDWVLYPSGQWFFSTVYKAAP
ncbi:MAG: ABC transporter substrate-binding protein [Bacillota bacterium]